MQRWRFSQRTLIRKISTTLEIESLDIQSPLRDLAYADVFKRKEPLLLRGIAKHWPALIDPSRKWSNLDALHERFNGTELDRPVRVEYGLHYMDPSVEVHYMLFSQFIRQMQEQTREASKRKYLAQQDLGDIPSLSDDIVEPEMCRNTGYRKVYKTNLWFGGSSGSVSPCHYDPYDNVLVQAVGCKEVILFHPSQSDFLYPSLGSIQKNTSNVDISNPDYSLFPHAKALNGYKVTLQEGDGLYIPKKWWHYIRTDSLSISVNFWWL